MNSMFRPEKNFKENRNKIIQYTGHISSDVRQYKLYH